MFSIIAFSPLNLLGQGNCNCSTGLNITSDATIKGLMLSGQLPFYSSNIGCISVADGVILTVNAGYTFIGTNFKMGANSKIIVNAPFRLTLQNNCKLEGCNGMWAGITLDPVSVSSGGELDMSNSIIEDAATAVFAQNQSKVRFVSNVFADNTYGLKITGFVPFINFENPHDFANNLFYATWPMGAVAITFDNAVYFSIGEDSSNPPAIVNTIADYHYGIEIKNSTGINIFGVTFQELNGSNIVAEPYFSNGICVRSFFGRDINVKYCTMTGFLNTPFNQPNFGITSLWAQGKQTFSNNDIKCNAIGISSRIVPFSGVNMDIQDNVITADVGIEITSFPAAVNKNLLIKKNIIQYRPICFWGICSLFGVGGILLTTIGAPNQALENTITNTNNAVGGGMNGMGIYGNTGASEIFDNIINFQGDNAGNGLRIQASRNCKIFRSTITGAQYNYPFGNSGINTVGCLNLSFCCNTVNQSDYGTRFNSANSHIKFYTTTYGTHDTALYFPPAATLNPQFNTGNNWAGASTSIDAFYNGSLPQAQSNAPFRTALANINASKIIPNGWFALTGTDPSCTQPSFSCPNTDLVGEYTELTAADLAALTAVNEENEYVLRFQQKRQLYRILVENPQLVNWNQAVSDFYTAAQSNTVGAFDALDEAFYRLYTLSPSLEEAYNPLSHQLDSLGAELNAIRAQYPSATPEEQETLLEQAHELADLIAGLQNQANALLPTIESEMQTQLTQLLAQNSAINSTSVWEVNEKNINDLYFKHYGGLIDTFTATEKSFIETLALSCPQYEGAGVYKARELYPQFAATVPAYHEHYCKPSEERAQLSQATVQLSIVPNPADEQITIRFGQTLPEGCLVVFSDITGRTIFTKEVSNASETTLDVSSVQAGIYLLTVQFPGLAPLSLKAVISH